MGTVNMHCFAIAKCVGKEDPEPTILSTGIYVQSSYDPPGYSSYNLRRVVSQGFYQYDVDTMHANPCYRSRELLHRKGDRGRVAIRTTKSTEQHTPQNREYEVHKLIR